MPPRTPASGGLISITADQLAQGIETVSLPAECCGKCRFFHTLTDPKGDNGATLCRRFPPTLTMLAVPLQARGVIPNPNQPGPMTFINQPMFSPVGKLDWCGEFKPAIANGAHS